MKNKMKKQRTNEIFLYDFDMVLSNIGLMFDNVCPPKHS